MLNPDINSRQIENYVIFYSQFEITIQNYRLNVRTTWEMTYEKFINNILETRGRNGCGDEYHETHHIVPKCMGGTNDKENLIDLFAREHFEAHRLLALENPNVRGLIYAWWCMSIQTNQYTKERYRITAEEYEEARIAVANLQTGTHLSEETKQKLSDALKGRIISDETKQKMSEAQKGRKWSEEHLKNIRIANKLRTGINNPNYGKHFSEEHRRKIGEAQIGEKNHRYGKHHTEEHKKILSEMNKGEKNKFYGKHHTNETKKILSQLRSKAVYCIEIKQAYGSALIAQEKIGISHSSIGKCCSNKQKTAGGYQWKYLYDQTRKDGTTIPGAITLGLIAEEEALEILEEQKNIKGE